MECVAAFSYVNLVKPFFREVSQGFVFFPEVLEPTAGIMKYDRILRDFGFVRFVCRSKRMHAGRPEALVDSGCSFPVAIKQKETVWQFWHSLYQPQLSIIEPASA